MKAAEGIKTLRAGMEEEPLNNVIYLDGKYVHTLHSFCKGSAHNNVEWSWYK